MFKLLLNCARFMNPQALRRRSASCPTDRVDTALPTAIWRCGFWAIRKSATTLARGKGGEIGWICRSKYRKRKTDNDHLNARTLVGHREENIKNQDLRKFSTQRDIVLLLTP